MEISVSHLFLVGFFRHPDRVLDAWVVRHLDKARAAFEANETLAQCMDTGPVPILLGRDVLPALSASALRPVFAGPGIRLLIWGNDDGKTMNLARKIGLWSMDPDPATRLRK